MDLAAERQRGARRQLHRMTIEDRQRAGQAETDRAQRGIGLGAEARGAAAENLGGGQQLRVDLEADDGFKRRHE